MRSGRPIHRATMCLWSQRNFLTQVFPTRFSTPQAAAIEPSSFGNLGRPRPLDIRSGTSKPSLCAAKLRAEVAIYMPLTRPAGRQIFGYGLFVCGAAFQIGTLAWFLHRCSVETRLDTWRCWHLQYQLHATLLLLLVAIFPCPRFGSARCCPILCFIHRCL